MVGEEASTPSGAEASKISPDLRGWSRARMVQQPLRSGPSTYSHAGYRLAVYLNRYLNVTPARPPPAHAETAHDMGVHAVEAARDRGIALSEREEGLMAQSPEYVALHKAHANFDFGFVARLSWTGRKNADPIISCHSCD